jgi:hypothetical protein
MVNCLGLDDDLDPVEVVELVEKVFDIEIANHEAEAILTVGQMYDLLLQKILANEINRKCASAMAFYRLRRALNNIEPKGKLTPATDLSQYGTLSVKRLFRKLAEGAELRMPGQAITPLARTVTTLLLIVFVVLPLLGLASIISHGLGGPEIPHLLVAPAWLVWVASLPLIALVDYVDPNRLAKDSRTLGDLAKKTAPLNFGRLVNLGASARESEIWDALIEVLSGFSNFPADQISRDTYFLEYSTRDHLKRVA